MKILAIMMLLSMTACGNFQQKPEVKVVTKVKHTYITLPEKLLEKCKVTPPPNKREYLGTDNSKSGSIEDMQRKEELLVNYSMSLQTDLKICNKKIDSIKEFQTKQLELKRE